MSSICCTATREVVVGVERAAVDLGPAVLAGQPIAGRLGALAAGQRVADALHALVVVGRRGAARLDADRAALRLDLLRELREVDADIVVVRADIGDAQRLVLGRAGRSPRSAPECRPPWPPRSALPMAGAFDGEPRCRRPLGDQVVDDLHLLLAAAMLAGADVEALDRAARIPPRPSCSRRAPGRRTGCSCSSAPARRRISCPPPAAGANRQRQQPPRPRVPIKSFFIRFASLWLLRPSRPLSAGACRGSAPAEPRER